MTDIKDEFRDLEEKQKIKDAVNDVTHLLASHDWERAKQRLEAVQHDHADSPLVRELAITVQKAREPHKQYLVRKFIKAAQKEDPEPAMELLKELDRLLTHDEARPLEDQAKMVIQRMKDNLLMRFKVAVSAQDWIEAKHVAELIISDFSNTRMAQEVAAKMDVLREQSLAQRMAAEQTKA